MPPEVEQAIDKRSSMAAVGNLNDYVKFQMAQGMENGGGGGAAGSAAEMAVGLAMAQQMMHQQGGITAGASVPDLLSPADAAKHLGVPETDVMAVIESGDLPAKKIGSSSRIKRADLRTYVKE